MEKLDLSEYISAFSSNNSFIESDSNISLKISSINKSHFSVNTKYFENSKKNSSKYFFKFSKILSPKACLI